MYKQGNDKPYLLEDTSCVFGLSKLACVQGKAKCKHRIVDLMGYLKTASRLCDILFGSSMPLTIGLTIAASRRTTNSNPSLEMSVTYLLGAWTSIAVVYMCATLRLESRELK